MNTKLLKSSLAMAAMVSGAAAQSSSAWPSWSIGALESARTQVVLGGAVGHDVTTRRFGGVPVAWHETAKLEAGIETSVYFLRETTDAVDLDIQAWSEHSWARTVAGSRSLEDDEAGRAIEFRVNGRVLSVGSATIDAGSQTWRDSSTLSPTPLFDDDPYAFYDIGLGMEILVFGNIDATGTLQGTTDVTCGAGPRAAFDGAGGVTMLGEAYVAAVYGTTFADSVVVTEPEFGDITISPDLASSATGVGGRIDYELAPFDMELTVSRELFSVAFPVATLFSMAFAGDHGALDL